MKMRVIKFNLLAIFMSILAIFAFVNLSHADQIHDDPKYLIDVDEVQRVLSLNQECCENETWPNLHPDSRYPNLDYKFPLKEGRSLFFLCHAVGAHTVHYKVFVEVEKNSFELLSFPFPEFRGEPEILVGISSQPTIFNPKYNLETGLLVAWDFAMAGDWSWEYTYQFIDEDDVGFVLLSYKEDTATDNKVEYTRIIEFAD